MLQMIPPCTHGKRAVRGALTAKNSYCIHHNKHHYVEGYPKKGA